MSYILDALKKSQAEQAGENTRVQLQHAKRGIGLSQWLAIGLGLLLIVNVGVMLWFFVFRSAPEANQTPAVAANSPLNQNRPETRQPTQVTNQSNATIQSSSPPAKTQPARTQQNIPRRVATPAPSRIPSPIQSPTPARVTNTSTEKLPRLQLNELPEVEQTLYKDFRFSSHMYSPDDPEAGAIFIDGQMLKIGAAFKGLTIVEINEFAVVFKEVRRGKAREVEIQLADHWN